jgi:hypothetical protein
MEAKSKIIKKILENGYFQSLILGLITFYIVGLTLIQTEIVKTPQTAIIIILIPVVFNLFRRAYLKGLEKN